MPTPSSLPEIRRALLARLKHEGPSTTAELASHAGVTYEAVRQQLRALEADGFVAKRKEPAMSRSVGRPTSRFALTPAGDHFFAKRYDALAVELIDTASAVLGPEALTQLLATLTEERVRAWAPRLEGLSLEERLTALRDIYLDDDPFTTVEHGEGGPRLIERNCPYLNVASRRPALCSVTVSTLIRLLGAEVVRDERFQEGDGRCVFRVLTDRPVDPEAFVFAWEPDPPPRTPPRAQA
jgi:predicted ArsR family transcriptional regulator